MIPADGGRFGDNHRMADVDALVIGSGPNGLVAADMLARRGWEVLVCEGFEAPGGGVRSEEATLPGYIHDHCAGFFPLAMLSEQLRDLPVRWLRGVVESAHPRPDGSCAWLAADIDETARALDGEAPGDGAAWKAMIGWLDGIRGPFLDTLLTPVPNIRAAARMALKLRLKGLLRLARTSVVPVRDLADQEFLGRGPGTILTAFALHSDLGPEQAVSGVFALVLAYLAQTVGFTVPEGGAGRLSDALVARLHERSGRIRCSAPVTSVIVRGGRAAAVRAAGEEIGVRHAVLADTGAPALFRDLVGEEHLPGRFLDGLRRFRYGAGVFKVDWALGGPVPWSAEPCRRAATVHVGDDVDDMSRVTNEVVRGLLPAQPYLILGQQSLLDPSRAPAGHHTLWGYTHVPSQPRGDAADEIEAGSWEAMREAMADRVERRIEHLAPGFRDSILARRIITPTDFERTNPNLVGGEHNGGTGQAHQQLVFRPVPGWFRYRTPVKGLYLASASAHPGGGVHGACGAGAAKAATADRRLGRI